MKNILIGNKPFKCEQCFASFARKDTLNLHKKSHTGSFMAKFYFIRFYEFYEGERPFNCDHCSATFTRENNLKRHEKRHKNV